MQLVVLRAGLHIERQPVKDWNKRLAAAYCASGKVITPLLGNEASFGHTCQDPCGGDMGCCNHLFTMNASAALRMPSSVLVGVMACASSRQCRMAGLPLARARTKAGANSSVVVTRSP